MSPKATLWLGIVAAAVSGVDTFEPWDVHLYRIRKGKGKRSRKK